MNDGIVLKEIGSGVEHVINLPCVIGRGKDVDLALADQTVSHRHAFIDSSADRVWIKDLKSANGTLVNDLKVTEKTDLKPGDTIQFGQSRFLYLRLHKQKTEETLILHTLAPSAELPRDFKRLELIYAITAELPEGHDVKDLGENIFALFKEYFKQDRAYIALFQEDGNLQPLCCAPLSQPIPLSRSIVSRIFSNGESFLLSDALSNGSLQEQESIIAMHIRSAMCAPLTYHNQIYGLIYLDRDIANAYNQQDLELFRSIAAIIAPLIENARLWRELQKKYTNTVAMLQKIQARLIDTERIAAYSMVAQAMAHEIRNPLTTLGGLIRRIAQTGPAPMSEQKCQAILQAVERIELVLREVDSVCSLPVPDKKLVRIDSLVQALLETCQEEWDKKQIRTDFSILTPKVMAPVDAVLLEKAIIMILKEILLGITQGGELPISLRDGDDALELCFGSAEETRSFADPFAREFKEIPWRNSLFLNIAHKILLDHGGKLLLNIDGQSLLPLILRLPRSITIED